MKYFLIIFLSVQFGTLNGQLCEWVISKDLEHGFRISFPATPTSAVQEVPTVKGAINMHTLTYNSEDLESENLLYMHAYTAYPEQFFEGGLTSSEDQQEVLSNSVEGAVSNTKGTLLDATQIEFNGYPGRHVKIAIDGGYVIEMKTILVGFRLYLIQLIYLEGKSSDTASRQFFDSFELLNIR